MRDRDREREGGRERGLFLGTGSRDVFGGPAVLKSVGQAGSLKTQS